MVAITLLHGFVSSLGPAAQAAPSAPSAASFEQLTLFQDYVSGRLEEYEVSFVLSAQRPRAAEERMLEFAQARARQQGLQLIRRRSGDMVELQRSADSFSARRRPVADGVAQSLCADEIAFGWTSSNVWSFEGNRLLVDYDKRADVIDPFALLQTDDTGRAAALVNPIGLGLTLGLAMVPGKTLWSGLEFELLSGGAHAGVSGRMMLGEDGRPARVILEGSDVARREVAYSYGTASGPFPQEINVDAIIHSGNWPHGVYRTSLSEFTVRAGPIVAETFLTPEDIIARCGAVIEVTVISNRLWYDVYRRGQWMHEPRPYILTLQPDSQSWIWMARLGLLAVALAPLCLWLGLRLYRRTRQ